MTPLPKTIDEHIDYHFNMARLKLWFAWNRAKIRPDETLESILRYRTNLWRIAAMAAGPSGPASETDYAAPEWRKLLLPLLELYENTARDSDADRFEKGGFEIFRNALEEKARATFVIGPVKPHGAMGALSYDPPAPETPCRVAFHIDNPLQPRSIFDDPGYLPACLRALMDDAEQKHGTTELQTATWLNSHPAFLKNFPPEYIDNAGPEDKEIRWGDGFWGQFTNARGCFNEKFGQHFRRTGELPYWRRKRWCSFEALRRHLSDIQHR
jgi:hypothetical protein